MREFTYLADGGASVEGEGHLHKPWGFSGGKDGACAELELEDGMGGTIQMPSKMPYKPAKAGSKFIAVGPAGGGYGDPLLREPTAVLNDVLDGYITQESAQVDYGVVIKHCDEANGLVVDEPATRQAREGDRAPVS